MKITRLWMVGVLVSMNVWAAVPSPSAVEAVGTTQASSGESTRSLLDDFYMNYFMTFHGAPVANLGSSFTVDRNGVVSKKSAIYLDSELTTAYLIDKNTGIGPSIPFWLVPVMGQGFTLGDVGLKGFERNTINTHGFNLYTNLYLQAPTNTFSQARGMMFAVKTTPALRFSIPRSRFTVGAWTELKEYAGVTSGKTFKAYAEPYVSYQIMPKLSANVGFEYETDHNVEMPWGAFAPYQSDFQPGIIWNITPKILFNPYLQIFTTNNASYDTTAVGAVISATLL